MKPFARLHAVALPVAQPNVDTDQILPARYLQKLRDDDFGQFLFRDLRHRKDGSEDPGFLLNRPAYRAARVLVAERNFACGSSREHAVWALHDYGIRAVIAPSFGDIFHPNALKNGLLPVVLPAAAVAAMLEALLAQPGGGLGQSSSGGGVVRRHATIAAQKTIPAPTQNLGDSCSPGISVASRALSGTVISERMLPSTAVNSP